MIIPPKVEKVAFKVAFTLLIAAWLLVVLSGCASGPDQRTILDRVEFAEDEVGCFRVTGTIGGSAFTSANAAVILIKKKGGDDAPDC